AEDGIRDKLVTGVQTCALPISETALLEYALGEDQSYLWVVTPTSIKSVELPKRAEIETSVRRVIELLSDGKRWTTSAQINAEYEIGRASCRERGRSRKGGRGMW